MAHVKYTGTSDEYILDASDFKRGGVEGARKTRFPRDVPVQVDDSVSSLLLESEEGPFAGFSDVFEEVSDEDAEEYHTREGTQARSASKPSEADQEMTSSEADQEMTSSGRESTSDTAAAGGGTRRGGRARSGTTTA